MKHIFLTGDIGCGKSTLIRRVLETAGSQITVAGGFLTGFENNQRFGPRKLYMCNAKNFSDPQFLRQPVFSQVYGGQAAANLEAFSPPQIIRETFEDFGVSLIEAGLTTALNADKAAKKTVPKVPLKNNNNGGSVPVLIFDECGYMEAEAPLFRQAVIRSLDSPVPILGVIRQTTRPSWLDQIRAHPDTLLMTVTPQNRYHLVPLLCGLLCP